MSFGKYNLDFGPAILGPAIGGELGGGGDIDTQYGDIVEQPGRWRRVVNKLDACHPDWRRGHRFLGDAAVAAIDTLTIPLRRKVEAQKLVDAAKAALAKAEAELKALT